MTRSRATLRIFTRVDVLAGVAVAADNIRRLEDAQPCRARLRTGRDPPEDEVRWFQGALDAHPGTDLAAEIDHR